MLEKKEAHVTKMTMMVLTHESVTIASAMSTSLATQRTACATPASADQTMTWRRWRNRSTNDSRNARRGLGPRMKMKTSLTSTTSETKVLRTTITKRSTTSSSSTKDQKVQSNLDWKTEMITSLFRNRLRIKLIFLMTKQSGSRRKNGVHHPEKSLVRKARNRKEQRSVCNERRSTRAI